MQYNWIFNDASFECAKSLNGLSNVVEVIHWEYEVTDGEKSAATKGTTALPNATGENFVAFEDLTKETVIGWLESLNDVDYLKAMADYELYKQEVEKNRVVLNPPF